jgi:CBS domain containing-hemolysin-like protein
MIDIDHITAAWLQAILCLVGAACIVAVETAMTGLPLTRVQRAVEQRRQGARLVLFSLQAPAKLQLTLRCAHLLLVGGTALAAATLGKSYYQTSSLWPLVAAGPICLLVIADVCGRYTGRTHPLSLSCASMGAVQGLTFVMSPLIWPLGLIGRAWARFVGHPQPISGPLWTAEEVNRVDQLVHASHLSERHQDLFVSLTEFSGTVIREVMVPRTEMVTMVLTTTRAEVYALVLEAGHSRIPVYDDTIDNVAGVLHVKDLFVESLKDTQPGADFDLHHLVRPTFFVPEVMKISELLREFQRRKTHMAIVVDEYGGTAGVVTLEDIIEEIVGEIQDEYDVEEKQFRVLSDNKLIADARVSIWDLEQALGVQFPSDGEYETLAGFLMSRTGALPAKGTIITWHALRFVVKEANEKRIGMVEIERRPAKGTSLGEV